MDMFVKYYVLNGILVGMREDASFKITGEESGEKIEMNINMTAETCCTDFGTTTVTKPQLS